MKNLNEYGPSRDKVDAPSFASRGEDGRLHGNGIEYEVEAKKVTAKMSGYNSQKYTKLAKKVQEAKRLSDELAVLKEEIKSETREQVADLFAAEDTTRTRVIETVSFTMKLGATPKATESYKYAEIVKALEEELTPELLTVLNSLKERFKTVTQKEASLSVELREGIWDSIVNGAKKLFNAIKQWASSYDKKLAALKKQAESLVFESAEWENADGSDLDVDNLPFPKGTTVYSGSISGKLLGWASNKQHVYIDTGVRARIVPIDGLTDKKPSLLSKAASWIMGEGENIGGSYVINSDSYAVKKRVMGTSLVAGMRVLAYDGTRTVPYEVIDFHDETNGKRYNSAKELMAANGVKSLSALGDIVTCYANVKDLEDGTSGEWFYIHNGRWVYGSGATSMSFTELGDRINESGNPVIVGESRRFETKRELIAESVKADVYVVAVPHKSDISTSTPVMYVRGFNFDGSTDCIACSAREALAGIDADLNSIPSDKVLTMVTSDIENENEKVSNIWFQDGAWRDADGEVRIYQLGDVEAEVSNTDYGDFSIVSKWELPSGKQLMVVKDMDGQAFVIDDRGASHQVENPMSAAELENMIATRGGRVVPLGTISESSVSMIREFMVDPSDAFPIPATLSDEELEVHLKRWEIDKRYVDKSTPESAAYAEFGKELEDEAASRK